MTFGCALSSYVSILDKAFYSATNYLKPFVERDDHVVWKSNWNYTFGDTIRNVMCPRFTVTYVMNVCIANPLIKISTRNIVACIILIIIYSYAVIV